MNKTAIRQASKIADVTYIIPMEPAEARACLSNIKGHLSAADAEIIELHDRQGWKALGYESWKDCVRAELDVSRGQGYRLLAVARARKNIKELLPQVSPIGDTLPLPNEAQARKIAHLEPAQQAEVWQKAVEEAPEHKPTAKRVGEIAAQTYPKAQNGSAKPAQKPEPPARGWKVGDKLQYRGTGEVVTVRFIRDDGMLKVQSPTGHTTYANPGIFVRFGEWKANGVLPKLEEVYAPSKRERALQLVNNAPDDLLDHIIEMLSVDVPFGV